MPANESMRPILGQLLEIHRAALELRAHATSFHVLSAAAHAAEDLDDLEALEQVAELSRRELAWIDANAPGHRLSSASARKRNHQSVFEQLAVTAQGMRKRIEADRVRRHSAGTHGAR